MANTFIVETSARHLHVTEQDLETLFGKGAKLHYKKELSQPGQYACEERVDVVGHVEGSAPCKLVGPCGEVELKQGVIVAKRHCHFDPAFAEQVGVKDKDIVSVKINTPERSLVFGDVVIRVSPAFRPAMHIDTDEANAAGCAGEVLGEVVK